MASQGHIKIDRRILNWEWYRDSNMVHVFLHLLLTANYTDSRFQGFLVKRGQVIIGRLKLAAALGLTERQIRTCLNKLKMTNEISIKTTNKFSVITIVKYDDYQSSSKKNDQQSDQQDDQQQTIKRPTNDQQATTSNKDKEYKEGKEDILVDVPSTTPPKEIKKPISIEERAIEFKREFKAFVNDYPIETLKEFYDYWIEPNKSKTKMKFEMEKTWDLNLRLKKWARNSFSTKKITPKANQPFF